ncbi:hypothetical protein D3C72_1575760 [compost metagenome]
MRWTSLSPDKSGVLPEISVGGSVPFFTVDSGFLQCEINPKYKSSVDWLAKIPAALCNLSPTFSNRLEGGKARFIIMAIWFHDPGGITVIACASNSLIGIGRGKIRRQSFSAKR